MTKEKFNLTEKENAYINGKKTFCKGELQLNEDFTLENVNTRFVLISPI